jgi:hypothetical protein
LAYRNATDAADAKGTVRATPHQHFGVWSGNATLGNFLFAKMSRIIQLPDQTRTIRQCYVDDIPFAKKFYDVHLPDQTPMSRIRNWSFNATSTRRGLVRQCDIRELFVRKNVPNYPPAGPYAPYSATQASDIQFAKKFCDVHLPDQTPM